MKIPIYVSFSLVFGHRPRPRHGAVGPLRAGRRPRRPRRALPVGSQQRVEILKALSRDVELLILDEPTAVLTPQETDALLRVVRELRRRHVDPLHHPQAARGHGRRRSRLRAAGQGVAGQVRAADTDEAELARLMVERDVVLRVEKDRAQAGEVVLDVAGPRGARRPRSARRRRARPDRAGRGYSQLTLQLYCICVGIEARQYFQICKCDCGFHLPV